MIALLALLLASPEPEIRAVLDKQVADWNRGNVEAFMQGYEDSPATAFVSSAGVTRGYAEVLANYKKRYPTQAAMGVLKFTDLEVKLLSRDSAHVTGRFHLERSDAAGGNRFGWFTLLFRRTAKGWKIILDHTS